jgi:hypothetical protein
MVSYCTIEIINNLDDIKEKITDDEYKKLVESVHKVYKKFVWVETGADNINYKNHQLEMEKDKLEKENLKLKTHIKDIKKIVNRKL